jgi:dihydroorotate dehydrogenase electron transfer subunit
MVQQQAQVLWNENVNSAYFRVGLRCRAGFARVKPGQFVMLRIAEGIDPLLRRPFSIHRPIITDGRIQGIEILYKVVGKGTSLLSKMKREDRIDVLGPLGSAFLLPEQVQRVFIVAGGIGIAPMLFLATHLLERGFDPDNLKVYLGGRTKDDLLCVGEFEDMKLTVYTTTDDGSAGDQCLVTLPVESAASDQRPELIYACGPLEMLKCVIGIAEVHSIECQVSIETRMACGMGACLGCAVAARDIPNHYYHACLDGPVFDIRTIRLEDINQLTQNSLILH